MLLERPLPDGGARREAAAEGGGRKGDDERGRGGGSMEVGGLGFTAVPFWAFGGREECEAMSVLCLGFPFAFGPANPGVDEEEGLGELKVAPSEIGGTFSSPLRVSV